MTYGVIFDIPPSLFQQPQTFLDVLSYTEHQVAQNLFHSIVQQALQAAIFEAWDTLENIDSPKKAPLKVTPYNPPISLLSR
jgi:hypothetical protein